MMLRTLSASVVLVALAVGCAAAAQETQPPATANPAAPASLSSASGVEQVLDALDRRGQNLRTLTADVRMLETDQALGEETARTGHVWLENLPDGNTRFRALFDRKEENG